MSRRSAGDLLHSQPAIIREAATKLANEWLSKTLPNIGPPDFSSSPTAPRGLDGCLNRLAKRAMRSSSTVTRDLEDIMFYISTNEYLAGYPQLVRPFFHHLQSTPPVRCVTEADRHKTRIGVVCFNGVYMVCEHIQRALEFFPYPETSLMIRTLTDSWPGIWKWIEYLYKVDPEVFSPLDHIFTTTSLRGVMIRILGRMMYEDLAPFEDAVEATPGVFELLVDIWERASEVKVHEETTRIDPTFATIAIQASIRSDPTRTQTLIEIMDGDINRVATLVMNNLRQAFSDNGKRAAANQFQQILSFSVNVADLLPGLHHALLSQNSMVLVTRTFGKISSLRAKPIKAVIELPTGTGQVSPTHLAAAALSLDDYPLDVNPATSTCLTYFEKASRTSGGFTWVIQAIRSGMIAAILRSACRSMEEVDHQLVIRGIARIIRPYLAYRSVLRAISKALQDPIIDTLESKLPRSREFFGAWIKFKELVAVRLAAKKRFDSGGEYGQRCSSARCSKVEGKDSFRLCSSCQDSCYCSPECQKYNWKHEGHREACASLRKDRADGVAPPISSRDLAFFHFLAENDLMEHHGEVLRLRYEAFEGNPAARRDSFIISINLISHPSDSRIVTHDYEPQIGLYKSTRQSNNVPFAVPGAPSRPGTIDIHIIVPYGEEDVIIPYPSNMTSTLFGWNSQLQRVREVEQVEM